MKELRCIVFTDRELVSAIIDRRRRLNEPLPEGDIEAVRYEMKDGVSAFLDISGGPFEVSIDEEELQAALVSHCMLKNIPLPADAEKTLYVIKGHVTLMITMNFRKPARFVARAAAAAVS